MRWKNFTIFFFVATLAIPALLVPTKRAEAFFGCTPVPTPLPTPLGPFVPVYDGATALQQSFTNLFNSSVYQKQCILDGLVKILAKSLINNLTGSIVDWINKDFQGGPAFITNPAGFFVNIADETAGNFIETQLGPIGQILCSPFDLRLRLNLWLSTGASRKQYIGCRLTADIQKNAYAAFTNGGFMANGGWSTFNAITSDPRNNQFGAFIYASDALNTEFIKKANEKLRELSYGRGFLSYKKCIASKAETNATGGHDCAQYQTLTPGSIIESQLGNALGTDLRQYELADNFNAILGAVVNYGLRQVFSSGGGLLSASSQGAGGASPSAQRLREGDFSQLYALSNEEGNTTSQVRSAASAIGAGQPTAVAAVGATTAVGGGGSTVFEQNLAYGRPASQSGYYALPRYNADKAVNGVKEAIKGDCSGFNCAAVTAQTAQPYWEVTLEKTSYIKEVLVYGASDLSYEKSLGTFKISVLKKDRGVAYAKEIFSEQLSEIPLSISGINTAGDIVRIEREDGKELALAEVEVRGTAGSTPPVGSGAAPKGVSTEPAANTTPILAASANVEMKIDAAVFTVNEPLRGAHIGVTMTKLISGAYTDFAPGHAFSKILVRVKNKKTGEIKLEEEFINNEPKTYKTQKTFDAAVGESIAVGYEFTPTNAAIGQTYGLITEITDSAGIQIPGAVSPITVKVP